MGRGNALPLYKRGVERDRFERAMSWLIKNVEQIMSIRGVVYDRSKSILQNLSILFECDTCPKLAT